MPRSRNIKPKFFVNEDLGECSPLARLLFIGLWTLADYRGVAEYRPKRIKIEILPYDDVDVDVLLGELEAIHVIQRFSNGGTTYLALPTFSKHQRPHHTEVKAGSKLPPPPKLHVTPNPLENQEVREQHGENPCKDGENPPDSCFLIPDSCTPVSTKQGASPKARPKKKPKPKPSTPKPKSAEDILASLPDGFKRLWEIAPEQARVDQVGAAMAYHKLIRTKQDPKGRGPRGVELGQIIDGLKLWVTSEEWAKDEGKFVPSLKKFFHDEQWKRKPRGFQQPAANPGVDEHPVDPDNQEGMAF